MWLESLREVLKIVSFMGLIATGPMMIAVTYKKIKDTYPVEVERNKWIFWVLSIVLTAVFLSLFQVLFPDNSRPAGRGIYYNTTGN
jgi:hypothetical protein